MSLSRLFVVAGGGNAETIERRDGMRGNNNKHEDRLNVHKYNTKQRAVTTLFLRLRAGLI